MSRGLPERPTAESGSLVELVGAKGAGKTTQLMAWRRRCPGPYHYVPPTPRRSRWAMPPIANQVYVDEIDRLARPVLVRWLRNIARTGSTAVVGTHRSIARPAKLLGLDVVSHHLAPAELSLLSAIIERRFAVGRLTEASPQVGLSASDVREVHTNAAGSLRAAEVLCHERVAALAAKPAQEVER